MSELYYVGDIGDLGNVDWFVRSTHTQIKDVTKVRVQTHVNGGVWATITSGLGITAMIHDGPIVPNPHLAKNGTARKPRKLANGFKTTDIVWHATRGSEWVKCRVIGGDGDTLRLIRLLNSNRFVARATDVTKCEPAATHRCNCSSQPGERHWSDCAALIGVKPTKTGRMSATQPNLSQQPTRDPDDEADRMMDFFKGKQSW